MNTAPTDGASSPGTALEDGLVSPEEFIAPAAWQRIDFISDIHLSSDMPLTFAAWRDYLLGTTADAVFILGDLFEAWVGDDARHTGLESDAAAVLKRGSNRCFIAFMAGNRDFLLGREMLEACGVTALPDPTMLLAFGQRSLLSHGDAWCIADVEYQQLRRIVRAPAWQRSVLARPLAERRVLAGQMRTASERRAASNPASTPAASAAALSVSELHTPRFDVDAPTAIRSLAEANATVLVHGHTHRPASERLAPGITRHVLSDWDLDHAALPRAQVLRWSEQGWARLTPARAASPAGAAGH